MKKSKNDLQYKTENVDDAKLIPTVSEGTFDKMKKSVDEWSRSYWYVIVIVIFALFMGYYMNYISKLHARIDNLEEGIGHLISIYQKKVNSTY